MSYYAKRFDLKAEKTTIEGTYDTEEEALAKTNELLIEEEKLPYTTCIFAVEETVEDQVPYDDIIRSVFIQTCEEEGIPQRDLTDEFINNFKLLL